MKRLLWCVLALACGCSHPPPGVPDPSDLVWVGHPYSGGRQCQPAVPYSPPSAVQVLRQVRVVSYATAEEGLAVCEACDCPGYSALHYALIAKTDLPRAAQVGYQPRTPPVYVLPDSLRPRSRG